MFAICSALSAQEKIEYTPKVFGFIKFRYEVDAYNGESRFNMANARLGARGLLSSDVSYSVQVEMGARGRVELLDALINYRFGNFELSAGQQQYHLSTELDRGPGNNYFANSSLSGSYITQYYTQNIVDGVNIGTTISSIGSRDMGATLSYSLNDAPLRFMVGAFNGVGINTSQWSDHPNFIGRVVYGGNNGFGAAASYYQGNTPSRSSITVGGVPSEFTHKIKMMAGELRYVTDRFRIESEVTQRYLYQYGGGSDRLTAAMLFGLYKFDVEGSGCLHYIAPVARWDYIDNLGFINESTGSFDTIDTHRVTLGVSFGLASKLVASEIRVNYDYFLPRNKPAGMSANRTFHNKFTLEFVASF